MGTPSYTCFCGLHCLASGQLPELLTAAKEHLDRGGPPVLIFEDLSGTLVDFNFTGRLEDVLARVIPVDLPRGPGRPKLGVTGAEVSLLPRHWEWLDAQPAKASGTIRRLVDAARQGAIDPQRQRVDAAFRFMTALAGDYPNYEEATRALYAGNWPRLRRLIRDWPGDIAGYPLWMLGLGPGLGLGQAVGQDAGKAERSADVMAGQKARTPELWRETAAVIVKGIAQGRWSAVEVMEACLSRIEVANPAVKAMTAVWKDDALEAARGVDAALDEGRAPGPLAGLPFVVKANIDVLGHPTDQGVAALSITGAGSDSPLVARLRAMGAIPLGHTNLPDLALRFETNSSLHGRTLNPWNPAMSPGGSSGGTSVALATGMAAVGLGNDAGGSLRLPALFAGLAALKPTAGRFPQDHRSGGRDPGFASQVIAVDGIMGRSIADLDLMLEVLSGPDARDPRAVPAPSRGPALPKPIPVAVAVNPAGAVIHPMVASRVNKAAFALERAGYLPVPIELPRFKEILAAYDRLIMTEFSLAGAAHDKLIGEDGRKYLDFLRSATKPTDLPGYVALTSLRLELQRTWSLFMEEWPLIIGPVFTEPFVPVDTDIADAAAHARVGLGRALCSASSFLGLPAVAVPCGIIQGMPAGVQLIGRAFREDLCLDAAALLEKEFGLLGPVDPAS
ncbi:MAG: DUF2239 family protein [Spirochaetota bacterium]